MNFGMLVGIRYKPHTIQVQGYLNADEDMKKMTMAVKKFQKY